MAFKRSRVRFPLTPPKTLINTGFLRKKSITTRVCRTSIRVPVALQTHVLEGKMQKRPLYFQFSESENDVAEELEPASHLTLLAPVEVPQRSVLPRPLVPVTVIARYCEDWISEAEYLQQSPETIVGKRDALKKFLWWIEQNRCEDVGAREIRRYLVYIGNGHLQEGGRWGNAQMTKPASARTIQYYFNYLRGFFRWMVSERIIDDDPTRGLAVPKFEKHQIQPFTSEQLDALMDAARRLTNPRRDEAALTFMLDTGLRASEFCSVTMRDVELHTSYGQVTVVGKGRKKRTVPFDRTAARALWHYLRDSPPRDEFAPLFQSDRGTLPGAALTRSGLLQLFERLGDAAGIKSVRCSPHTMRHTFAIMYLRGGGDVRALQRLLGHSDLKMTMQYLNIAEADVERQHRMSSPANRLRKK